MRISIRPKAFGAVLLAALVIAELTLLPGYAETVFPTLTAVLPQQMIARITTTGNRPISINGATAASGDSVATNATIETPPGVAATIDLGVLGKFDLPPGSKILLEYDENCKDPEQTPSTDDPNDRRCKARATVIAGCVTATAGKKGSRVEIATQSQGLIADSETEKKKKKNGGGLITGCAPGAVPPPVAGGGIGTPGIIGIIAAAVAVPVVIVLVTDGDDPSPSTP
ncbi:MAG TPA: hypothetical protein VJU86_08945 [Pyrinomonadaceae bacterium]|nr:hypothetical protein [Pyrinomonadaceae bacterium]